MADFHEFRVPPVIYTGEGALARVPAEVQRLGGRRVLLVTDRVVGRQPFTAELVERLQEMGAAVAVFDDIPGEPTVQEVERGTAALWAHAADLVIGLGGGSAMDTAKAVAMMAANPGSIADYTGTGTFVAGRPPLIEIATTAGTGSEVTRFIAITDPASNVKMLITDARLIPDVAVADPLLTLGCPPSVTASTGLDALTHAIEAYVSRRANPTSDVLALSAIRLIGPALRRAWLDGTDREARRAMMLGALHAGIAFSNASVALVHGMSRPIGAYFHIPHGLSNAMLLPAVMRFSLPGALSRYAEIGRALGAAGPDAGEMAAANAAVAAVEQLCRDLRVPRLSEAGIDPVRLRAVAPQMARDAIASGSPANNPQPATEADIVSLYLACL
jgi:alcohol dehydrogenase class IV